MRGNSLETVGGTSQFVELSAYSRHLFFEGGGFPQLTKLTIPVKPLPNCAQSLIDKLFPSFM